MKAVFILLFAALFYAVVGYRHRDNTHHAAGRPEEHLHNLRSRMRQHEHVPFFDDTDILAETGHDDHFDPHDHHRQDRHMCPTFCPRIYRPVCASNGRTYSNRCNMNAESCRNGRPLYAIHNGRC